MIFYLPKDSHNILIYKALYNLFSESYAFFLKKSASKKRSLSYMQHKKCSYREETDSHEPNNNNLKLP